MRPHLHILAAALLAVLASATTASAAFITYNLTGTWTGTIKCTVLTGGAKSKLVLAPTMKISQLGLNFGVQLEDGVTTTRYGGLANPDTKKPEQKGEAALIRCRTDNVLGIDAFVDEIARMSVSAKTDKVKATFKGVSIFSGQANPLPTHGTCKWKFTRVDIQDGSLQTECPGPIVSLPPLGDTRRGGGVR